MRKKNGFISMSIVYSFFAVFALVSSSLLLIYSTNLAIVKDINREIRKDLNKEGNDNMIALKNIIVDGSFEEYSGSTPLNWIKYSTNGNISSRAEISKTVNRYSGSSAIGFKGNDNNPGTQIFPGHNFYQSKETFPMYHDHYYYISRVYLAWNNIPGNNLVLGLKKYNSTLPMNASLAENWNTVNNYFNILTNANGKTGADNYTNTTINVSRTRVESAYCYGVNGRCTSTNSETNANTLESGIFKFTAETGSYRLLIGENFPETKVEGAQYNYCSDSYIMIDLTVAFQIDPEEMAEKFATPATNIAVTTKKIDDLLDGRYYDGSKVISTVTFSLF